MKKSQLRHIIRESIKELMTEQPTGTLVTLTTCSLTGPNTNWAPSCRAGNLSVGDIIAGNPDRFVTSVGGPCSGSPPFGILAANLITPIIPAPGVSSWMNSTCPNACVGWTSGMNGIFGWDHPSQYQMNIPQGDAIVGCIPSMGHPPDGYGYKCESIWYIQTGKRDKNIGNQCIPGTQQNPGTHATMQDCESDCDLQHIDGKTKTTTPFTTTPQSIVEPDDEITRMQDLANISKK